MGTCTWDASLFLSLLALCDSLGIDVSPSLSLEVLSTMMLCQHRFKSNRANQPRTETGAKMNLSSELILSGMCPMTD